VASQDFRAVMIYNNKEVLRELVEKCWDLGGKAEAAAKSSEKGGLFEVKNLLTLIWLSNSLLRLVWLFELKLRKLKTGDTMI
jgi:hypothetical protein